MKRNYRILSFTFIFPLIILLLVEMIFFSGIKNLILWILHNPIDAILGYVLVLCTFNIFHFLNQKLYKGISIFLGFILVLFSFISHVKYQYRGDILTPSDIFLLNEGSNISNYLSSSIFGEAILYLCLFILFSICSIFITKKRSNPKQAIAVSILSLIFLLQLPLTINFILSAKENVPSRNSYGLVTGLADNLYSSSNTMESSEEYNKITIESILSNLHTEEVDTSFKPNVIIVLSEAFWDPSEVPNLQLKEDPLPFYHSIGKNYATGKVLSPVFGGATANPEFESLTGLSTRFIDQPTPYVQVVNKPIDSLASIFSRKGYKSSVIHSYHNWFYDRPKVYQQFGFDNFISGEFFTSPTMIGPFMDDKDLFNRLVKEMSSSSEPDFIYAISMLNHGPYGADRFKDLPKVVEGDLTESTKRNLDIYAHSLTLVDQSLEQLITDLNKVKEPTILVYYGDHLPLLGENFDVYKELGYFDDDANYEEYVNKYTTPILIWNNYEEIKRDIGMISPNFIGSYVLEMSKTKGNALFQTLTSLRNKGITVIPEEKYYSNFNITDSSFDGYKLLQHDILFGANYSKINNTENNKKLIMGSQPSVIDSAIYSTENSTLTIRGNSFIPRSYYFDFIKGSQIYINNKPYDTKYLDDNTISTNVENELVKDTDSLKIDVRVIDTKGTTLSQSNSIMVDYDKLVSEEVKPFIKWAEPGEIRINEKFNESDGESHLSLAGEGFTEQSQIYINNIAMDSTLQDNGYISCIVPQELYTEPTVLNIEVKNTTKSSTTTSNKIILYVTN